MSEQLTPTKKKEFEDLLDAIHAIDYIRHDTKDYYKLIPEDPENDDDEDVMAIEMARALTTLRDLLRKTDNRILSQVSSASKQTRAMASMKQFAESLGLYEMQDQKRLSKKDFIIQFKAARPGYAEAVPDKDYGRWLTRIGLDLPRKSDSKWGQQK